MFIFKIKISNNMTIDFIQFLINYNSVVYIFSFYLKIDT